MMKTTLLRTLLTLLLALTLLLSTACVHAEDAHKTVNIAITSGVSSLHPLLIDATEVMKYALSLEFLPLLELNSDLEFVPQLAESITTEDNLTFTIRLRDDAAWSDGTPVTSRDVEFTLLLITSPEAGRAILSQHMIVGTDDAGMLPSGATSIEGVRIIDDKTLTVTTKQPTALYTFNNIIGRYLFVLPEHVLGDIPRDQLLTHEWFSAPTVISGPYFIQDADPNHYIRYRRNDNYFLGTPIVEFLNISVVTPAQLLALLRTGSVDVVQQTTAAFLQEDYEALYALDNVTVYPGSPVTNQSIFFNVNNVPDVRIRQALLYGMPRDLILSELLGGSGEVVDAFLCSASPYYSADLGVTPYDPDKAAQLVSEAAADGANTSLVWYVNSDDATFVSAVELVAALMSDTGLEIEIRTVNLDTLMGVAAEGSFDILSVQYTFAPSDPYTDMRWLLSADGWTRYYNPDLDAAFALTQESSDPEVMRQAYLTINRQVVADCPMISAYILSTPGAVNNRVINCTPDVFGTFINVHEWDVK